MTLLKSKWSKFALSIAITASALYFLERYFDKQMLHSFFVNLRWQWIVPCFIIFYLYQYLRILRIELLTQQKIDKWQGVHGFSIQSLINASLPAGLGEASIVYILQKYHVIDWRKGLASLIIVRLWDLSIFALLFLGLILISNDLVPASVYPFMLLLSTVLALLILGLFLICIFQERIWHLPLVKKMPFLSPVKDTLSHIKMQKSFALHLRIFLYSLIMWVIMYLMRVCVIYALNVDLSLLTIFWIYIIPIELLPIKGVANIGTFEATWFIILQFFGYSATFATTVAFGSHIIIFGTRFISAIISIIALTLTTKGHKKDGN